MSNAALKGFDEIITLPKNVDWDRFNAYITKKCADMVREGQQITHFTADGDTFDQLRYALEHTGHDISFCIAPSGELIEIVYPDDTVVPVYRGVIMKNGHWYFEPVTVADREQQTQAKFLKQGTVK